MALLPSFAQSGSRWCRVERVSSEAASWSALSYLLRKRSIVVGQVSLCEQLQWFTVANGLLSTLSAFNRDHHSAQTPRFNRFAVEGNPCSLKHDFLVTYPFKLIGFKQLDWSTKSTWFTLFGAYSGRFALVQASVRWLDSARLAPPAATPSRGMVRDRFRWRRLAVQLIKSNLSVLIASSHLSRNLVLQQLLVRTRRRTKFRATHKLESKSSLNHNLTHHHHHHPL